MKPNSIGLETLLVTTSSFAQRQFCEKDLHDERGLAPSEQLEAACWNGLLGELLPEIMSGAHKEEPIYLWEVEVRDTYLRLSLGHDSPEFESQFTIDPVAFCDSASRN